MANMANHGMKALVTAYRSCVYPDCPCKYQREPMRDRVNEKLDPSHQLDEAAFDAIYDDLDQNPITHRPATSVGEKQRNDGNFDRVVEEAFKAFRDLERETTLDAPDGSRVGFEDDGVSFYRSDNNPDAKFWIGAAHLRHYFEFFLVLKGIKPCVLFSKFESPNEPLFSKVIIDCLVPIMDRLDLWSYGFSITFQSEVFVFYDIRSPKVALVKKIFDTPVSVKDGDEASYPVDTMAGVPESEIAQALGYPFAFDDFSIGRWIHIRDNTELEALVARGQGEYVCCVDGAIFSCPAGDESVYTKLIDYYRSCHEAAKSVGTELLLHTGRFPELTAWLEENPSMIDGLAWDGTADDEEDAADDEEDAADDEEDAADDGEDTADN